MTRSEIIAHVAKDFPDLAHAQIQKVISEIFAEIVHSVDAGKRVEFRGFGAFSVRYNEARLGRNPKTGQIVTIPAKRKLSFKTGEILSKKLNSTPN